MMSSSSWLFCKRESAVVVVVLQERIWHTASSSKLSISLIHACFELSSCRQVNLIVVAFIVDVSSSIDFVRAFSFVAFEVVCEEVNSIFIFSHLIGIVNVANQVFITEFVIFAISKWHYWRRRWRSWI